jgi:hypothetical protein
MIGLLLLTIKPAAPGNWRWGSGRRACDSFAIRHSDNEKFRRFDPQQLKHAHATLFPFYLFVALGTGGTLLQFCNVGTLNAF